MTDTDPIRHVVVLALENHSFDQMLGCLQQVHPGLEGVANAPIRSNSDNQGNVYVQQPTTERQMLIDPRHEVNHVLTQIADGNGGFVKDFATEYPASTPEQRKFVMGYYPLDFLPALHRLGRDFTVCDHWFSSLPGPTWPNRFFLLSGTSNGRVNMPEDGEHKVDLPGWFEQNQDTIFDRLTERGINWKVYFHDIPQSSVLTHQRLAHNAARYFYIDEFFDDARGAEEDFPQFSFIEPDFMGFRENDDHPPHDVMRAEKLIADVYNALRANPELWHSTLFIVMYDEHGGFYDHVTPPPAIAPDDHHEEYSFTQLGVRVPALLISPWVDRRVETTRFDHTSLLKYLIDKWGLKGLGRRAGAANSIAAALTRASPRDDSDCVARIALTQDQLTPPDPEVEEAATSFVSSHHRALQKMGTYLKLTAVTGIPRIYAGAARAIEWFKHLLERPIDWLCGHRGNLTVSITKPDRISRKTVTVREDYAHFLMRQKRRALAVLGERLRNANLSGAERDHAVHTLALITGRRFHREANNREVAGAWLKRHGH
jgi:phospholipase C